MLLVVDVGNTHTALGLYRGDRLVHDFRLESNAGRTVDEYHVFLRGLLDVAGVDRTEIEAAILASVVPPLTECLRRALSRAFGVEPLVVGPGIKTGMPILYENPKEVGADRIVNAVAAYDLYPEALIVVDFGTATTFDVVSKDGKYLGGVISPGIQISANALFARAARLPRVEIAKPSKVIGRNTVHSMQSGIVYGYVGLVDGIVDRIQDELGHSCRVLATGGLATVVHKESRTIERVEKNLTLEGLRILHDRNA